MTTDQSITATPSVVRATPEQSRPNATGYEIFLPQFGREKSNVGKPVLMKELETPLPPPWTIEDHTDAAGNTDRLKTAAEAITDQR
jgi:hypothetical protein